MSGTARSRILERVRAANGAHDSAEQIVAAWTRLPRDYRGAASQNPDNQPRATDGTDVEAVLNLLEERLRDYDATVVRCRDHEVTGTVARMLRTRGKRRMLTPAGLREGVLPEGFEFVLDGGMGAREMDGMDGVLTESTLAIAETGTVVLQNVAGQGRRAISLVPDYHLCLVDAAAVVATVPEAFARLAGTARLATTFVSGPSATADIEMTRIKGVHGPRVLDIVLVCPGECRVL